MLVFVTPTAVVCESIPRCALSSPSPLPPRTITPCNPARRPRRGHGRGRAFASQSEAPRPSRPGHRRDSQWLHTIALQSGAATIDELMANYLDSLLLHLAVKEYFCECFKVIIITRILKSIDIRNHLSQPFCWGSWKHWYHLTPLINSPLNTNYRLPGR